MLDLNKNEEYNCDSVAITLTDKLAGAGDSAKFPHIFSSRRTVPLGYLRHHRATNSWCDRASTL